MSLPPHPFPPPLAPPARAALARCLVDAAVAAQAVHPDGSGRASSSSSTLLLIHADDGAGEAMRAVGATPAWFLGGGSSSRGGGGAPPAAHVVAMLEADGDRAASAFFHCWALQKRATEDFLKAPTPMLYTRASQAEASE